ALIEPYGIRGVADVEPAWIDRRAASRKEGDVPDGGKDVGQAVVVEVRDHRRTDFGRRHRPFRLPHARRNVSEGALRQDDERAGREAPRPAEHDLKVRAALLTRDEQIQSAVA